MKPIKYEIKGKKDIQLKYDGISTWLKIQNQIIVGIHSHRSDNTNHWVKYDGTANPGDRWENGKVISQSIQTDAETQKRTAARKHIITFYPEWKQINILRSGTQEEIDRMGNFIDACRDWSNDPEASMEDLENIVPSSSTVESSQQKGVIQRITNIWKK